MLTVTCDIVLPPIHTYIYTHAQLNTLSERERGPQTMRVNICGMNRADRTKVQNLGKAEDEEGKLQLHIYGGSLAIKREASIVVGSSSSSELASRRPQKHSKVEWANKTQITTLRVARRAVMKPAPARSVIPRKVFFYPPPPPPLPLFVSRCTLYISRITHASPPSAVNAPPFDQYCLLSFGGTLAVCVCRI